MLLDYVAEITIKPWRAEDPRDAEMIKTQTKIHPIHEADDGKVYIRTNASVKAVRPSESQFFILNNLI